MPIEGHRGYNSCLILASYSNIHEPCHFRFKSNKAKQSKQYKSATHENKHNVKNSDKYIIAGAEISFKKYRARQMKCHRLECVAKHCINITMIQKL
jgi:hypothetical protein